MGCSCSLPTRLPLTPITFAVYRHDLPFSFPLQSPLALASKYGHIDVVTMFLHAEGVDVNKGVSITIFSLPYPLVHSTATNPYLCLLPSIPLQAPLMEAAKNGHTEIVTLLLKAEGVDVNKGVSVLNPTSTLFPYPHDYH